MDFELETMRARERVRAINNQLRALKPLYDLWRLDNPSAFDEDGNFRDSHRADSQSPSRRSRRNS